jgi:hypothetical protein
VELIASLFGQQISDRPMPTNAIWSIFERSGNRFASRKRAKISEQLQLKAPAAPVVIPRQGIYLVSKFPRIRLLADWIAVILALSAKMLAMHDRRHRSSPEIGR